MKVLDVPFRSLYFSVTLHPLTALKTCFFGQIVGLDDRVKTPLTNRDICLHLHVKMHYHECKCCARVLLITSLPTKKQ